MTTPEMQRERAGCLYLLASDAFARDDSKFGELLVTLANRYADQAAGLWTADNRQKSPVTDHPIVR